MRAWIYVEGQSDVLALNALWVPWRERLHKEGHGIKIIALESKSKFLRKIGDRAAEKLASNSEDVVVGLPDLYPNKEFSGTYAHADTAALQALQRKLVENALVGTQRISQTATKSMLERFFPSALKHDLAL